MPNLTPQQIERISAATANVTTGSTVANYAQKPVVLGSNQSNVLNGYRSYTYVFTMAALKPKYLQDPNLLRESELELVILRSGGKGTAGISTSDNQQGISDAQKNYDAEATNQSATTESIARAKTKLDNAKKIFNQASSVIPGFNKSSPGRFDMFISNVEIDSIFGFTEQSSVSLPNNFRFEVTEPYSINGFLEALHTAAIAAGYPSYTQAVFLLKVEFIGYPDNKDISEPEYIPNTERYFPFRFSGVDVEITEKGTVYRCTGTPFNERAAFGHSGKLKKPVNMVGSTVGEILKDLMVKLTEQQKVADQESKENTASSNRHDTFEIKFPIWGPNGWDFSQENEIAKTNLIDQLKDPAIYKFDNPASTNKPTAYQPRGQKNPTPQQQAKNPESSKYTPGSGTSKPQIQFNENATVVNIIAAIIRDSNYTKDLLEHLEQKVDQYGYVDYFLVTAQATYSDVFDTVTRRNYQNITYIVTPYKVHYKRIPGYGAIPISEAKLKLLALREYNYVYTGKNTDVLNFKLNFNNLFFEAVPLAQGNTDQPNKKYGIGPAGTLDVKVSGDNKQAIVNSELGTPPVYVETDASAVQPDGGMGNRRQDDPYAALARSMHKAIVDSNSSMLTGDIEIIGDPLYLVTGGIGNYNPAPGANFSLTKNGEANHTYREIVIAINFRNPVDVGADGFIEFDPNRVAWSGVYRVTQVKHTFNDGIFKQSLKLIRIPGQVLGEEKTAESIAAKYKLKPKISDIETPQTTVGVDAGRPTAVNLFSQLQRGLPSLGLPGALSNFTGAVGGLGGTVSGLLNQVSGAVTSGIGKLTSAAGAFGGAIPGGVDQLASGIRLQASGLVNFAQQNLGIAAVVNQVANTVETNFPVTQAAAQLASGIVSKASSIVNSVAVPGSGIGAGASVLIDAAASVVPSTNGTITAQDIKLSPAQLPTSISALGTAAQDLAGTQIANVAALGSQAASLAGGIGSKLSGLISGSSTDPTGLASGLGINVSSLSGLSAGLQSKVLGEVGNIAKSIPTNVDLGQAVSQGLVLDFISKDKFANIPATAPFIKAPNAEISVTDLKTIASAGPAALARSFGVSDISKVSSSLLPDDSGSLLSAGLSSLNAGLKNPFTGLSTNLNSTDVSAFKDKLGSAASQLSGLTGKAGSVEGNLSSLYSLAGGSSDQLNLAKSVTSNFGSLSSDSSPLKKLFGG